VSEDTVSKHKWFMLALATATGTLVVAAPFACLPVLFGEISEDLGLSLVQIGAIWGTVSLAGIFVSLLAGLVGDRFSAKFVLGTACLLVGITGALRGLATNYLTLAATVFIFGIVRMFLPINITKSVFLWFKGRRLGLANGIMSMGIGSGLMLGSWISATVLSPLLGGWRGVLFLYGALSIIISVLWFWLGRTPSHVDSASVSPSLRQLLPTISKLIRIKSLWLVALTLMFRIGSIIGMTGYLPLYLRGQGWAPASADSTLAGFYAVSTIFVIPLSSLSDRLGSRKAILIPALLAAAASLFLLPLAKGAAVWALVLLVGVSMDTFMALTTTMLLETEGIGSAHSGTALGLVFTIAMLGGVFSPPIGNSLASISPGFPFFFWAILSIGALVASLFIKETIRKAVL